MEYGYDIVPVIIVTVFFLVAWVFYFWIYQEYRVDKTRQEIFAIRDELFDFAAAGNIYFNHPSYVMLRTTMNGMIRFTHRVNLIMVIMLILMNLKTVEAKAFVESYDESVASLDSSTRDKLNNYLGRMNWAIVNHLIRSSIILMFFVVLAGIVIGLCKGVGNLKKIIVTHFPGISLLDKEAALRG